VPGYLAQVVYLPRATPYPAWRFWTRGEQQQAGNPYPTGASQGRPRTSALSPQGTYPAEDQCTVPFPPGTLVYLQKVRDQCTVASRYYTYLAEDQSAILTRHIGLSTDGQGPLHRRHKVLYRPKTIPTRYFGLSMDGQGPVHCRHKVLRDQCTIAKRYLYGRRPVQHSHQVLWSFYRRSGTSAPSPQGTYLAKDRSNRSHHVGWKGTGATS
jgi:hypothetical protein